MKWRRMQRRVGKNEVRGRGPRNPWYLGVALLLSLLIGVLVAGVYSQEQPGARRVRPTAPPPPVEKAQEPAQDYRYNVQDRRDPLEPLVKEVKIVEAKPKCAPGISPAARDRHARSHMVLCYRDRALGRPAARCADL